MPIVGMPDGTQVQFPDEMPADQIRTLITQKFPGVAQKQETSYADKSAGDIASEAVSNAPASAVNFGKAMIHPIMHPIDTANFLLRELPVGIGQKLGMSAEGPEAEKLGQIGQFFADRYGSKEGIKKAIATDPVGVLADISTVMTGGGGLAARAPGIAGRVGEIARVVGTATDPLTPVAAAARRVVSPLTTPPTRAEATRLLREEGVDVTAGQSSGKKYLRKQEEELGGGTTEALAQRQGEQFTSAALRRVGEDAARATTDVVDNAFNRIGGDMNRLAARNRLQVDSQLRADLQRAEAEYNRLVAPNQRAPIVGETLADITSQTNNGQIAGDVYQSLRSRLGTDARAIRTDPHLQGTLYGIQNAVDSAMERSIQRQNPRMVGEWQEARRQYRDLLVVEKAINYAGEAAAGGIITPQNLARAVKSVQGERNYSRGRGDLQNLARAGAEVMTPLANSNTASRLMTNMFLHSIGATLGGGAGFAGAGAPGLVGGTIAGAALPRVIGEGLVRGRRYLGNTLVQAPLLPGVRPAGNTLFQFGRLPGQQ